ncbi:AbrB/MazE/SpoVT family DNA-binding domain-containing protein [Candidatus Woesearchaeota archaeon]|nr:AbrB/MazE/SpoVT family DNA-binding domain-containing protein [Candidatus Woesearchaeota archaeon]
MSIAHVTVTGNISLPKNWREELGITPGNSVVMEMKNGRIVIEPLKVKPLMEAWTAVDAEMKRKKIHFTREEAVRDDLYD